MKQFLLVFSILMIIPLSETGAQVLPFSHYTPDTERTPLPSAEVLKVFQDRLGYMWFAVYSSGLARYNGVHLDIYDQDDGLRDLMVWDMIEDPTGRLWVSSNAGIVVSEKPLHNYNAGESVRFIQKVDKNELLNVAVNHNRMAVDTNGWLWIGTENLGIVRYKFSENNELQSDTLATAIPGSTNSATVRSLSARKDGTVWVSLLGSTIVKFNNDIAVDVFSTESTSNTNILYEDPDGSLWGGEQTGRVWQLNEENNQMEFVEVIPPSGSNIPDIKTTSDGNIWISSEGSGLFKLDKMNGYELKTYTRSNGLLGEIIYNVFEDQENNVWIAQSGGISKLRYNFRAFKNLTSSSIAGEAPVLPSTSVNVVLSSPFSNSTCPFLVGTSEGGLACLSNTFESIYIQQNDGLLSNWVNGLAYDQFGTLWVGTSRGLNSISFDDSDSDSDTPPIEGATEFGEITIWNQKATLSTYPTVGIAAVEKLNMPRNFTQDSFIESILLSAYQTTYILVNNQLFTLDQDWGLPATLHHAAAFDDTGHLWIGTRDRGIYRSIIPVNYEFLNQLKDTDHSDPIFEQWWSTENDAPSNQIEKLLWHEDTMWVGTPAGLIALDGRTSNTKYHITTNDGLKANNATSFALSPVSGTLWVGTNQGLAEIDPATGLVLSNVTRLEGLIDNEVWFYGSVHIDPDGIVYFGTAKGLSIYDPSEDRKNEIPPVLRLTNISTEKIQGERNEFIFEYAALSFGNERQVRYQTRLIGFNDEWSPEKTDTRVNFTNLSALFLPKVYTFEVRAINESGVSSVNPLSYEFSVDPPFYLSWVAFLLYFIFFGISVFGTDRFQRARLIKKEREAAHLRETELKAETAIAKSNAAESQAKALQAENNLKAAELEKARELEIAYHELKSTQNRLIQAEKMASLGRLSTGIAHEIKNPLNFINNFSEVSRELVDELKVAIESNDIEEIEFILSNLSFNTEKIEEHGKRADSIIRSMMQHSRGGEGEFEVVDLNQLIQKFTDLAYHGKKSRINHLDVIVNTRLDSSVDKINIIPQKVGQVLQNIIENAIDSIWEHKKKLNGEYKPEIEITSRQINGYVEIKISDNGPGIPEHIKEKIFEPFFTTKPTGEGTGLGLSLSYDFITQIHNGKLELGESDLGGAAFIITLPVANE